VTVTTANEVRLTEHDAYSWVSSTDDQPISAEVKATLAEHFGAER
jgi:8-oxo-dGTP diphosphatase